MIADYSLHDVTTQNPNCHILLTLRQITENGFAQKKKRSWNGRKLYNSFQEKCANITNQYLALHGYEITIDHRFYAKQGIDLHPPIHIGIQRKDHAPHERFQKQQSIKLNAENIIANLTVAIDLLYRHQAVFTNHDIALLANTYSTTL
jgi:hypothetical protein